MNKNNFRIAIIGLGYVGLPLAVEFGKVFNTIGFDINKKRVKQLSIGKDITLEVTKEEIRNSKNLTYTHNLDDIKHCNIFIITVPTPIDIFKKPDLEPLTNATKSVSKLLKKNDIVVYESTVYPGATEEVCVPILEKNSKLKFNIDFYCGYSPERINPGDKKHRLTSIIKVTSGSTPETASKIDNLYKRIIPVGTHKAESIKVAEAAKVIENTQRDVNIALINELALIFNKLGIDTESVLKAAGSKWNFLPFRPGLVGGHCIGVDPYYLTHKALEVGLNPEMILAGRKVNDNMGNYIVERVIQLMTKKNINISNSNILILGLTFKENCPDLRNTKVIDLVNGFKKAKCNIDVYDPWVNNNEAMSEYQINLINYPIKDKYDGIVIAVAHDEFRELKINEFREFARHNFVLYDVKYLLDSKSVDGRI
jgi:UDP-N-acetyl-D-glucosamine/UDP-N-acetyl-D-galactosamine dehydrogenase